jgi:hypothetical protein
MDKILSPNLTMVLTQGEIFFVYCWDLVCGQWLEQLHCLLLDLKIVFKGNWQQATAQQ